MSAPLGLKETPIPLLAGSVPGLEYFVPNLSMASLSAIVEEIQGQFLVPQAALRVWGLGEGHADRVQEQGVDVGDAAGKDDALGDAERL